jgi:uncharacterized OsmC-like protein
MVSVRQMDGKQLACNAGRHVVYTDRKADEGGDDSGCTSGELLLLAIGSCATGSVRTFLESQGAPAAGLQTEVTLAPSPTGRERDMIVIELRIPQVGALDPSALKTAAISGGVVSRMLLGSEIDVRILAT